MHRPRMFREPDTKGYVPSPNDTIATFEPEDVVVIDLDGSTRHYATSNTVQDTTCIQEQDHEPSLHSHQEAHLRHIPPGKGLDK